MRYLTDRKRAEGKGAAHSGTQHHWSMTVSAVGLTLLVPFFLVAFGRTLGGTHAEVTASLAHPCMAILTGLVLFVGLQHFHKGAQIMLEDYSHGMTRKFLIIGTTCLSYGLIATGLFALGKIAL